MIVPIIIVKLLGIHTFFLRPAFCAISVGSEGDFLTIQEAIDSIAGPEPHTISLAGETLSGRGNCGVVITKKPEITIRGAESGSLIDCELELPGFNVFSTAHFHLYHLTIRNAQRETGAALNASNVHIFLDGVTFNTNSASEKGGAIYIANGDIDVEDCEFNSNSATEEGGAIYIQDANLPILRSTFSENSAELGADIFCFHGDVSATSSSGSRSGKDIVSKNCDIYQDSSSNFLLELTVKSPENLSTVRANFETISGALRALPSTGDTITLISGSRFQGDENCNIEISHVGPTIIEGSGDETVIDCERNLNGLRLKNVGDFELRNFTIENAKNVPHGNGAALSVVDASVSLSGMNFRFNTAVFGGALYMERATVQIENCLFQENVAEKGGAIYSTKATLNILQTRWARNTARQEEDIYCESSDFHLSTSQGVGEPSLFCDGCELSATTMTRCENSTTTVRCHISIVSMLAFFMFCWSV